VEGDVVGVLFVDAVLMETVGGVEGLENGRNNHKATAAIKAIIISPAIQNCFLFIFSFIWFRKTKRLKYLLLCRCLARRCFQNSR
jgi:hypothetical protein